MAFLALLPHAILTPLQRIEDGCVLVRDARIEAVGPRGQVSIPSGARRVELPQALAMLTLNPARLLGLTGRKGVIAPGADADLVCPDSNLQVRGTVIQGIVQLDNS